MFLGAYFGRADRPIVESQPAFPADCAASSFAAAGFVKEGRPVAAVWRGNLLRPEWWAGARLGWVPDSSGAPRWPLFENGSSDLTLHFDETSRQFIVVQAVGFGPADVTMRTAPELTGPWTAPQIVYRPPEYYRPHVMIYSAKAHPELAGGDLVVTYATNTFQFAEHLTDGLIYYPRFLRLTRCR
jgi:hypothetical protein